MRAREGVVDLLNQYLTVELTAINEYFLASEMCANWGFGRLRDRFRSLSLDAMKDAQALIAHILYLDGLPNLQRLNQVKVGQDVPETLQAGLDSEREAVDVLRGAIELCTSRRFHQSKHVRENDSRRGGTRRLVRNPARGLFVPWVRRTI